MPSFSIRLHAMFPSTSITTLRDLLLSLDHSFLFEATERLLSPTLALPRPIEKRHRSFFDLLFRPISSVRPKRPVTTSLTPGDLFKSNQYEPELTNHLREVFPSVPTSFIKNSVARGGSFDQIRRSVSNWKPNRTLKTWLVDFFLPPLPPHVRSSNLRRSSSSSSTASPSSEEGTLITDSQLLYEIQLFSSTNGTPPTMLRSDLILALALNRSWTAEEQFFSCGCCYDDVPFEEISTCTKGHVFCAECVARQVREMVFGQASFRMNEFEDEEEDGMDEEGGGREVRVGGREGEGTGVRCLSSDGCRAPFSLAELERVLRPSLFLALEKRWAEVALEGLARIDGKRKLPPKIVRCPWCSYAEVRGEEDSLLWRAFPMFATPSTKWTSFGIFHSLISFTVLLLLYPLLAFAISLHPSPFVKLVNPSSPKPPPIPNAQEPTPPPSNDDYRPLFPVLEPGRVLFLAHTIIVRQIQKVVERRSGTSQVFQCKNGPGGRALPEFGAGVEGTKLIADLIKRVWPTLGATKEKGGDGKKVEEGFGTCGRWSCLNCERAYTPGAHDCFETEKEGLRLAVEKAMTEAVKRTCHQCFVSFQKVDGCNRVRNRSFLFFPRRLGGH